MALFPPRPQPLANYDWIDFASATGYVVFDGLNALNSVGNNYILLDSSAAQYIAGGADVGRASSPIVSTVTGNSGQSTDVDFDLSPFQLPRTIEGDAIVRICLAASTNVVAGAVATVRLRKISGGESTLASATSETYNLAASTDYSHTLKLTIAKTHFKKGDVLRLTLEITTTDNDNYRFGHNPKDTAVLDFDANNSRMTVAVPFKLDFL